ncbi:unnamed protein product [Chrysodeixis includens]|uniref:Uncharacterized protein n=1 Tax=Chrysodeixis includens TaxID=689277 RepID=A0A9N8PYI8_CHRIL|nr:unnamed protein product [Chrysodeixis includens]
MFVTRDGDVLRSSRQARGRAAGSGVRPRCACAGLGAPPYMALTAAELHTALRQAANLIRVLGAFPERSKGRRRGRRVARSCAGGGGGGGGGGVASKNRPNTRRGYLRSTQFCEFTHAMSV